MPNYPPLQPHPFGGLFPPPPFFFFKKKKYSSPCAVFMDHFSFAPVIQNSPRRIIFKTVLPASWNRLTILAWQELYLGLKSLIERDVQHPQFLLTETGLTDSPHLKGPSPTESCTEHATAFDYHRVRHKDRLPLLLLANLESLSKGLRSTFQQ